MPSHTTAESFSRPRGDQLRCDRVIGLSALTDTPAERTRERFGLAAHRNLEHLICLRVPHEGDARVAPGTPDLNPARVRMWELSPQ